MSDPAREVLASWKEVAAYLGRSVRAVQLWEKEENLPVHRHQHDKQGSVFAYRDEIDRWREARRAPPAAAAAPVRAPFPSAVTAAVLAVAVIATVIIAVWSRGTTSAPAAIHSIAVLPFTSNTPADHVSDGLTEMLIDELATSSDLRVMARGSVFRFKGETAPPASIGRDLGVGAVMTGEVRRDSDRYVVRVELIDVRDGAQLFAQRYVIEPDELPLIQHRICADVSSRLGARPTSTTAKYSTTPEAYEQYLLGLRDWNRRSGGGTRSKAALEGALAHFNRAIALDPRFAQAYAGIANTYGVMVGMHDIPAPEGTMRVLAAARKALELDPNNAEAYTSLATTSFRSLRDFASADRDYQRAIALNPSFATAHQWYAGYLRAMGRFAEARREIETAYRLDPLSGPITSDMCTGMYYERRYRDAIRFAREVEARDPGRTPVWCAASSFLAAGDFDGFFAYRAVHGEPSAEPLREAYRSGGARAFHAARLRNLGARPGASAVMMARRSALAGEVNQAFAWLDKAYERNESEATNFHLEPELDALRGDPRFDAFARRVGLPPSALSAARALVTPAVR